MIASMDHEDDLASQVFERRTALQYSILDRNAGLLADHPPETYLALLRQYPPKADYAHVSRQIEDSCRSILQHGGQDCFSLYHRIVLAMLIEDALTQLPDAALPNDIKGLYLREFRRILHEMTQLPDSFYCYRNDKFLKDLALCRMKLIPVGAGFVDTDFILSKRFLLKQSPFQIVKACCVICFITGGFYPYYRLHIDTRFLAEFNPKGWDRAYLRIARMLELNPQVKGIVRSTWFLDPRLETISPNLVYLRKTIEDNDGYLFRVGSSQEQIKNATIRSPLRKKLYEEGKYMPTEYLAIWPRKGVLRWAASTHHVD